MMFTFVNYTIITCYIACVRYQEPKKGSSERSFCRQLQHAVWRRQNQQSLEDIPLLLWRLPKIVGNVHARGFGCFQEAEKGMIVLVAGTLAELRCGCGKLVLHYPHHHKGPWFWEEKLGVPLEVCHVCFPVSSGRVFGSAPVCFCSPWWIPFCG